MSASEERHILEAWHSNPLWKMKVDKMSDEQVIGKLDSDVFRIRIKNRSVSGRIASVDIFPRSIKRLSTIE